MLPAESVTAWLDQLKAGQTRQAEQLWQRYKEQLVRLACRKLGRSPRRVADEEDVVLSAFDGFLRGVADDRFTKLHDRDDLWLVLVMLTERQAIAARRREQTLKRGRGKVRGESVFAAPGEPASHRLGLDQAAALRGDAGLRRRNDRSVAGTAEPIDRRRAAADRPGQAGGLHQPGTRPATPSQLAGRGT
jgi:hypothetical protein